MPSRSRLLLDTHILVRLVSDPKRLSKEQTRVIVEATAHDEPLGVAVISLVEIASLLGQGRLKLHMSPAEMFDILEGDSRLEFLPVTFPIATEVAALTNSTLRDPADLAIVATARVHNIRLVTSDQPIVESGLVRTID